jgi:hypothetical protein
MNPVLVRVLLVGESRIGFSCLLERLQKGGCQCHFTASCVEGAHLVADSSFDLVLCSGQMDGSQDLISAVQGSNATLFRYVLVEDGCWWVPAVLQGEQCAGAPALRPSEFAKALDTMVREARTTANMQVMTARCAKK